MSMGGWWHYRKHVLFMDKPKTTNLSNEPIDWRMAIIAKKASRERMSQMKGTADMLHISMKISSNQTLGLHHVSVEQQCTRFPSLSLIPFWMASSSNATTSSNSTTIIIVVIYHPKSRTQPQLHYHGSSSSSSTSSSWYSKFFRRMFFFFCSSKFKRKQLSIFKSIMLSSNSSILLHSQQQHLVIEMMYPLSFPPSPSTIESIYSGPAIRQNTHYKNLFLEATKQTQHLTVIFNAAAA